MAYKRKTKKIKKYTDAVIAHIKSTFNNTVVTVTTMTGDPLLTGSAGRLGYKGARKGTPFAATQVGSLLGKEMSNMGVRSVDVNFSGPGSGRDSIARAFQAAGLSIRVLRDVTPLPHNGCRPPKKRRV